MSYINPLAAAYAQTGNIARISTGERTKETRGNSTSHGLPVPPEQQEVETRDAVDLHDEQHQSDNPSKRRKKRPPLPPEPETADEGLDIQA